MSEYKLGQEIVARSVAQVWDAAKMEWGLDEVYEADEPETCLCGHFPIIELCVLINKRNGRLATVGNCCVKKFMGLPSDLIFQAVKRVRTDSAKSLNAESIEHARSKGWINAWESDFYYRIMRKRKLSDRQAAKKKEINEKFILNMKRANIAGIQPRT